MNSAAGMNKVGVVLSLFGVLMVFGAASAPGEASALCRSYRPMSPSYWKAHQMMREGNPSEARRLFLQSQQYPGQAAAWMASAYVSKAYQAERSGKLDQAIPHLQMAMHEHPGNWSAANAIVTFYEKRKRPHDALLAIRAFPRALARNPAMLRIEARILEQTGDRAAAKRILDKLDGKAEVTVVQ